MRSSTTKGEIASGFQFVLRDSRLDPRRASVRKPASDSGHPRPSVQEVVPVLTGRVGTFREPSRFWRCLPNPSGGCTDSGGGFPSDWEAAVILAVPSGSVGWS